MECKDELKEIDIKNCTRCYFDDIIRFWDRDIGFSDSLSDENLYKDKYDNFLIHGISYKTSTGAISLRVRFDKIDEFIKIHSGIRYLALFDYGGFDKICNRIKCLISKTKVVLQILLIIILPESELIHIIFKLLKKY